MAAKIWGEPLVVAHHDHLGAGFWRHRFRNRTKIISSDALAPRRCRGWDLSRYHLVSYLLVSLLLSRPHGGAIHGVNPGFRDHWIAYFRPTARSSRCSW